MPKINNGGTASIYKYLIVLRNIHLNSVLSLYSSEILTVNVSTALAIASRKSNESISQVVNPSVEGE